LSKCSFTQRKIDYLGHVISTEGVATNLMKITAIDQWPSPTNVKQLRSFFGLAGYYRKFFRHFGITAKPLTELLKKHTIFIWTDTHEQSFLTLKRALVESSMLALPDFTKTFQL
jgi:hypothetical protein